VQNSASLLLRVTAAIKVGTLTKYWLVEISGFFTHMEINGMISVPRSLTRSTCRKWLP